MKPARILIADDSQLVLRMLENMFHEAGLSVVTARDGLEAVEKAFSENVSLIILDVMMPRLNGYQACRILKSETATQSIPVVILTSKDQAGDRFWGLETGADRYVTKDAAPQTIVSLVKELIAGRNDRPAPAQAGHSTSIDILSRVNDLLDRKLYEATILTEIGRVARNIVNFEETFVSVMRLVGRVVDFSVGAMAFVTSDELDLYLGPHHAVSSDALEDAKARVLQTIFAHRDGAPFACATNRILSIDSGGNDRPEEAAIAAYADFPITTNDRLSGLLMLGGKEVDRMTSESRALLAQVANQAHIVCENSLLIERLRELSVRDGLTEVFNHRYSLERLSSEFDRVGRYHEALSVLMIDIDHFKRINDRYGHQAGDAILREAARVLMEALRSVDVIGRYGGEEFVIILPHTRHEEARQTAERLRLLVERHPFPASDGELHITVSVGVATYPGVGVEAPSALIRESDRSLYRAKQAGRNRVE
ncbi:MAG: diguanylate cyclase [Vicinamibacteria bacterium]|nr:diguanylate cyclase [Vicinamibacteria bacterium]